MKHYLQIPEIENKITERYFELQSRAPIVDKDTKSIKISDVKNTEFHFEFFKRDDFGGPHLEYTKDGLISIVYTERGQILKRIDTHDLEEIMYHLFSGLSGAAQSFELWTRYKRDENADSRRVWMPLAVAFMAMVKPGWGERLQADYNEVLTRSPFSNRDTQKD